ncbi:MAG: VanZ family protein [Candidatus Acetothermia bacterium]|nr:VanZ family protein [Candidatus Acetothermia bacterium]MDH7505570.1 VanZ family protein [Candidatus Acetothermia bacterium]
MNKRLLWGLTLLLYSGLIFWLSSLPLPEGSPVFPFAHGDKLWHFLEYLLFGLLAWKAFNPRDARGLGLALIIALAYAGSDELHQLFVPTRSASILDWGADSLGALGGLLLGRRL